MEERDNGSVQVYMTNDYHCTTTSIKIKTRCIEQCMTCYTVSAKYIEFLLMYFLATISLRISSIHVKVK
jgi:hypothetical protein